MSLGHGGRRKGAGRKPRPHPALHDPTLQHSHSGPTSGADRACYARILDHLNAEKPAKDTPEIERWRKLVASDPRIALDALKYLYDKRDGKAIQPLSPVVEGDFKLQVEYLGAKAEFFEGQAKALGLLPAKVQ